MIRHLPVLEKLRIEKPHRGKKNRSESCQHKKHVPPPTPTPYPSAHNTSKQQQRPKPHNQDRATTFQRRINDVQILRPKRLPKVKAANLSSRRDFHPEALAD